MIDIVDFEHVLAINAFHATVVFLYPRKISENLWFSHVFRGYGKQPVSIAYPALQLSPQSY